MNKSYLTSNLLIAFILFCSMQIHAQDAGSWNILNVKKNQDQRWSLFGEVQLRSLGFYQQFHYYEYKGGFNFKVQPQIQLSMGIGKFNTFSEGGDFKRPMKNDEFRIWPQVTFSHSFNRLKVEHRYRSEFRFTSAGYKNRFRYRLGLSYAFGKQMTDKNAFLLCSANEVFFSDKEPFFERNRWLMYVEKKLTPIISLQSGYIYQFDYKINDETGKSFFQTGIYLTFQKKKFLSSSINENQLKEF